MINFNFYFLNLPFIDIIYKFIQERIIINIASYETPTVYK